MSVFSRIQTEYWEILRISPYLFRMRENTVQKKLRICTLFTQSQYEDYLVNTDNIDDPTLRAPKKSKNHQTTKNKRKQKQYLLPQ